MIIGIIIVLLLLFIIINKQSFSDIIQTSIILSYKVPIDNVLLFPLLVIMETNGKSVDYFNKNFSNYSENTKEYPENLFNNKGIVLSTKNSNPKLPLGVNNNYSGLLSKGDNPYFSILFDENNLVKPLDLDKKYVLGVSLQLANKKNTKYTYINLVFNNKKLQIIYPENTNLNEIKNVDLII